MSDVRSNVLCRWFEEIWNKGQIETLPSLIAPDIVVHDLLDAWGKPVTTPEQFKDFWAQLRSAFPDVRIDVEDSMSEGNKVMVRCTVHGTHTGEGIGVSPTNAPLHFSGMCMARLKGDRIVEVWNKFDFPLIRQYLAKKSKSPLAFISYRRQDSSAAARWLQGAIRGSFGPDTVFMDTEEIRMGDKWADRIHESLSACTVLISVIGPHWLQARDEQGRRRIDNPDDWVRNELAFALQNDITIIPVLLNDTRMPAPQALEEPIRGLAQMQAFQILDGRWLHDLKRLIDELEHRGFPRLSGPPIRYPKPLMNLRDLTHAELAAFKSRFTAWSIRDTPLIGQEPLVAAELHRTFEFATFEKAMEFMTTSAKHMSAVNHHARWENIWRTVNVGLSTWDIGHKPSDLDVQLAEYLEGVFVNMTSAPQ